jgi:pyruvate-ferredoxin/flavodoxin oxidoreductase
LEKYDTLKGLKKGGTFLYNSLWDVEETKKRLPDYVKKYLAENNISMYIINATELAESIGLGNRTNTILQSAFFKISEVIPYTLAVKEMKTAIEKTYGRKGDKVVEMNNDAVDAGAGIVKVEIPAEWAHINIEKKTDTRDIPDFIKNIMEPMTAQKGDNLPVSAFLGYEDGTFPAGTTAFEKRGIAVHVPEWIPENCIQCNQCALVCPHAAIRPYLLNDKELAACPNKPKTLVAQGKELEGLQFRMQVSPLDCSGCGNCADVCPAKTKALEMKLLESQLAEQTHFDYMENKVAYKDHLVNKAANIKNSQFAQPLFEFSGACTGCGETPYIKTITQLFGEQMMVSNATGCSSIYGGSAPATPYCKNKKSGFGPAWANSLFEDNAEYGFGMALAVKQMRNRIERLMKEAMEGCKKCTPELKALFQDWIANKNSTIETQRITNQFIPIAEKSDCPYCKQILDLKQYLVKKSQWIFGGDGWAYDIGFGGLDHVLACGEDVNILVMDTEVYSNTGGQSSKATPAGAVAKFATSGKKIRKKELGMIAASYVYVYVAQVAIGASQTQWFKALKEAEAFDGPSIIIAYSPCINHGLTLGMGKTQYEQKLAVECGYWHLWRYNPDLEEQGQNPFILDSKEPDWSKFQDFLKSEVRYASLISTFPDEAKELFKACEENAKWRFAQYKRMAGK